MFGNSGNQSGNTSFNLMPTSLSQPSYNGPQLSSHAQQHYLGNFELPQSSFNTNLNLPVNARQPLLFDYSRMQNQLPSLGSIGTNMPNLDMPLDFGTEIAKKMDSKLVPGLEKISLGLGLVDTAKNIQKGTQEDMSVGIPKEQAAICNTLGNLAQLGTETFFKEVVTTTTVFGGTGAVGLGALGAATGNVPMMTTGALGATTFANLAVPAYKNATEIAKTVGQGVTNLCHTGFEQAKNLSQGIKK